MWKYANPGDYRLLNRHNGTTYVNSIEDYGRAPKTGCSYTTQTKEDYPIQLPDDMTDFWFKADILVADDVDIFICNKNQNYKVILKLTKNGWHLEAEHRAFDYNIQRFAVLNEVREETLDLDGRCVTIQLHIKSVRMNESSVFNLATGLVELRINNRIMATIDNLAIMNGEPILFSTMKSEFGYSYFSNIIVSDEKIVSREHVCTIPVKATYLNGWIETVQDGDVVGYETAYADKSISHTIDVDALVEKLGENISISSISFQAFDISSNDEEVVDSIQKAVIVGGDEFVIDQAKIIDNRYISNAVTQNPYTNLPWTIEDLKTTELILRSAKSEVS